MRLLDHRRSMSAVRLCVTLGLFACPSLLAFAQTDSPSSSASESPVKPRFPESAVRVDSASRGSFEAAFTAISQRAKVTIIAEGVPFHATLTDDQRSALGQSLPADAPAPLAETVAKIAAAFDYDAEQINAHTFLLRKRYSDENDLPCVTYEEVVHSLRSILNITNKYAPFIPANKILPPERYYRSLSDDQKKRAVDGLMFADLTPEQQNLAIVANGEECVGGDATYVKQVYDHLVALKNPHTEFTHMMPKMRKPAFGYRGPCGPAGHVGVYPLDNRYRTFSVGYSRTAKKLAPEPGQAPSRSAGRARSSAPTQRCRQI